MPHPFHLCLSLAITLTCATVLAAPFQDPSPFSDRDERSDSSTRVALATEGDTLTATWSVSPQSHGGYGGFSVALPPLSGFRSISFSIKKSAGSPEVEGLTLSTASKRRYRVPGHVVGPIGDTWTEVRLSLDDFQVPPDEVVNLSRFAMTLIKIKGEDLGDGKKGTLSIKQLAVSTNGVAARRPPVVIPTLPPKQGPGPHGHGAWIYKESPAHVAHILAYNQTAAVPIRHLFVYGGSLRLDAASGSVTPLREPNLAAFRRALPPSVAIHANFDAADGARLGTYPNEEQVRLASALASAVNGNSNIQGVHLDIEPYVGEALPFYIALKQRSTKPVSASVGAWDRNLMRVLDFVVLMGYDLAGNPEAYGKRLGPYVKSFAADARASGTPYFIGLPFVASTLEFESRKHRTSGKMEPSGFTQLAFATAGREALLSIPDRAGDPLYGGVGIWGFIDEGKSGVGPLRNEWGMWPTQVSKEMWALINTFP